MIGAIVVVGLAYGRQGLWRLLRATFKWRVHPVWYVIALAGPIALWGIPALIVALGGSPPDSALLSGWMLWPVTLVLFGAVQGPLTEEPGWRGLALPLMLRRHSAPLSSLVIGVIWFAWHLPLFIGDTSGQRPLVPYATFIVAQSVLLTGIYLGTRGSVFLVVIFHAAVNATAAHLMPAFSPAARDTIWLLFAGLNVAMAVAVALWQSLPESRPGHGRGGAVRADCPLTSYPPDGLRGPRSYRAARVSGAGQPGLSSRSRPRSG